MVEMSIDPNDRMGVFKEIDEVPTRYRFHQFSNRYDGQDVWEEYLEYYLSTRGDSSSKRNRADRAIRRWKSLMNDVDRHYALAHPRDIEKFSTVLLREYEPNYGYDCYWSQIERLYTWLLWHRDHPHRYHPFWMAAAKFEASSEMWNVKMLRPREGDSHE